MPIYEYRCENGHSFEALQSMSDDPVASCPECGAATQRVFHPVAVHFKGSGFYTTDYARQGKEAKGGDDSGSKSDSKASDKPQGDSGSKSDSKAKSEAGSS